MSSPPGPGKRVVIYVEDDPSSIAFMRDLLADFEQIQLLPAFTPRLALELIRAWHPDLVIVNMSPSGARDAVGVQPLLACPELRGVPVIGLGASPQLCDRAHFEKTGVRHYLAQPIDVGEFMEVLDDCLGTASAVPGTAPRQAHPQSRAAGH